MTNGFNGIILRVDLSLGSTEKVGFPEHFYRTYLGGGAVGAYFLLKEIPLDVDGFDARNILTLAPSVTTGCLVSGVSRCSAVAISPLTNAVGEGQAGGSIGPLIKLAGLDAIVITGRAKTPSYLFVDDDTIEIRDASHLSGHNVSTVYDTLHEELSQDDQRLSIIQCGPAGEQGVRFACLMVDRNNVVGRTGLGAVMGNKNLRAVVVRVPRGKKMSFANPDGLKALGRAGAARLPEADFPNTLRAHGTPGIVGFQAEAGNMATHNYSRGQHKDYKNLTGQVFDPKMGAGKATCFGCVIACRKRVKLESPYQVSDKLGGPEFETLSTLGSNLDITDAAAVAKANELCNEYGIDTITMGGLAAYLIESMEQGEVSPNAVEGRMLSFGNPDDLLWLIERVGERKGVGDVLAEGFKASVFHFGDATAPYAIHCKGQGLPAHLPQVKPSQALMYAACPVGGDHMSAEHDWLLAGGGELARALGIIGEGNARSTGLPKIRMTAYGQHFYSLLDSLTLCMFVWGPGNLYTYRELEDLVRFATGWECTLWELMKAGERKNSMMRQINARRGFTREDDVLPARLFEPIPDGPSEGSHVDPEVFHQMLKQYYALMGWELETGNPSAGKLMELGLEWVL